MRNMLLETWGEGFLLYSGRKLMSWMAFYNFVRTISDELGYLAEEIFKQNIEIMPGFFFLLLIVKCKRKEVSWGKKNKAKRTRTWHSQPVHIGKDNKIRRSAIRKACSGKKVKGVAGQPFASALERAKDQSIHIESSLKRLGLWLMDPLNHLTESRNNDGIIQERTWWEPSCLIMWTPLTYMQYSQGFWECYTAETLPTWTRRQRERSRYKQCWNYKIL